jgi:hypothetical protein
LGWPFDCFLFDIGQNGDWWPGWGERPEPTTERADVLRDALAQAPTLIPLYSHRHLPESPAEAGNPVFSMHGFDTIYYRSDLADYFSRKFGEPRQSEPEPIRRIAFWSDLVEHFNRPDP